MNIALLLAATHLACSDCNDGLLNNPGVFLHEPEWAAGVYKNSYRDVSVMAAFSKPIAGGLSLDIGAASGYYETGLPAGVIPVVAPRYTYGNLSVSMFYDCIALSVTF